MISYSKIKSAILTNGKRLLKVLEFGAKTASQASPFGDDSSPLKNMTAIYARTTEAGERVILGYINKNQLAQPGEKRIFSLQPDGTLSFSIHLKGDGTCEIGGNAHNMVRFTPLETGLHNQDALINAELTKVAAAIAALGGSYVPAPVTTTISASKINEVKTA